MLYCGYNTPQPQTLYYEILEHSILELETKRVLKILFTGLNNSEEVEPYNEPCGILIAQLLS
jgi:hypothetical protein